MGDSASGSAEALVRTSERLPAAKKSAKIHFGDVIDDHGAVRGDPQAVTQPPHQQIHRSPDVTGNKQKSSRRSSKRSSVQGPAVSASQIGEAAGDVSDLTASLLLACLFCHFSDCVVLIPGTCSSGVRDLCPHGCLPDLYDLCCCPSCCCTNNCCEFLDVCHHTAECLELAMEISALCYH